MLWSVIFIFAGITFLAGFVAMCAMTIDILKSFRPFYCWLMLIEDKPIPPSLLIPERDPDL